MTVAREPSFARLRTWLRMIVIAGLAALAASVLPAVAEAKNKPPKLNVMSRNVYLGSDLTAALTAPDQATLFAEAGQIWENMGPNGTNFVARAKLLADEIVARNVDLVGLQEAALWRRGPRGAPDGPATPATEVVYDFIHQLRSELNERGAIYDVVSVQNEADLESPLDRDGDGTPEFDGRLTMRDAILAKRHPRLKVVNPRSDNFGPRIPLDLPPEGEGPEDIEVTRGWNAVEVVKRGGGRPRNAVRSRFRFVNTHLEAFSAFFRQAQASALIASGILDANKPVVLVGDLNSDPDDPSISPSPPDPFPTPNAAAYGLISDDGFVDRGVDVNTCCHDDDLLNAPPADFSSRIDHVLTKPALRQLNGELTGADEELRTPTGLWPSDHGGVFSRLQLRR